MASSSTSQRRQSAAKYQSVSPNSSSAARRYSGKRLPSRTCFLAVDMMPPTSPKRPCCTERRSVGSRTSVGATSAAYCDSKIEPFESCGLLTERDPFEGWRSEEHTSELQSLMRNSY